VRLLITEPRSVVSTSFGSTVAEIDYSDDGVVSSSLVSGVSTLTTAILLLVLLRCIITRCPTGQLFVFKSL